MQRIFSAKGIARTRQHWARGKVLAIARIAMIFNDLQTGARRGGLLKMLTS
ncbi:hypothetical protein ACU63Y_05800 [Klebsiella aerogenes]